MNDIVFYVTMMCFIGISIGVLFSWAFWRPQAWGITYRNGKVVIPCRPNEVVMMPYSATQEDDDLSKTPRAEIVEAYLNVLGHLTNSIKEKDDEIEAWEEAGYVTEEKLEGLHCRNKDLESEYQNVLSQCASSEQDILRLENENKNLVGLQKRLRKIIQDTAQERSEAIEECDGLRTQITGFESCHDTIRDGVIKLQHECDGLRAQNKNLLSENEILRSENEMHSYRESENSEEIRRLYRVGVDLRGDISRITEVNNKLHEDNIKLSHENAVLGEEYAKLRSNGLPPPIMIKPLMRFGISPEEYKNGQDPTPGN